MGTRIALKDINLKPYVSTGVGTAFDVSVERVSSYVDKEVFFIDFHTACGNNATLNVNGLGVKNITIGGINVSAGQILADFGYFVKYDAGLDKFIVVGGGGGGGGGSCADVKNCIENFTELDLSNLETLILGGPSTDIFIDGSTIHYNNVTENWSGDNTFNLLEGASITNNLDGTVNNNYGDTYEENNVYEPGSTFNHTGEVTNNYEGYIENNNYSSDSEINHNGGTHNYDGDTNVNFEGDTNVENLTVNNITISGGGTVQLTGAWEYEETPLGADVYTLLNTPVSEKGFMVFVDSGTGLFPTTNYTYDPITQTITFNPQLGATEKAIIWVMKGTGTVGPTINPVEPAVPMIDAEFGDYILVTYTLGASVINLPDATLKDGGQIRIKKFTGEDVLTTTIVPQSGQLIDGFTGATMNINRTMYTFTAINGNRYLGD